MKAVLLVGLGGAIGSMMRFLTTRFVASRITHFPALYGTFAVNIVGCLLIGIVFGLSKRYDWLSPQLQWLLTTGFCGGYTTFSTFANDNVNLLQDGNYLVSFLYILSSVAVCVGATFIGMAIVKIA